MITKCINCGKEKQTTENRLSIGKDKYCNNICKYEYINKTETRRKFICANCGTNIYRSPSQVKSENMFCSMACKAEGQSKGLTKPMRLGTGTVHLRSYELKKIRSKYYRYRMFDGKRGFNKSEYKIGEFIDIIQNGECFYCLTKQNLGFDRIDNKKGHTKDNVVVCCENCNMTKGDRYTVEQMKKIGEIIRNFKF